jgi:virulence-associated protein VapD
MKQTLLTLSFLTILAFMTACSTTKITDEMAVVGNPSLSSDPCAAIDEKVLKLDRFTQVVKNTSAFHLEEKANAIPTPGITVSNNRKQMLDDAQKKYAQYEAERQKYGCATPVKTNQTAEKLAMLDTCTALDQKVMQLDRFTDVVKYTSAFHLEEKANAIPTPGITVSNNRKQMLRDAKKKYAQYEAERQKYGCATPVIKDRTADAMSIATTTALSSVSTAVTQKEPVTTTMATSTSRVDLKESNKKVPAIKEQPGTNREVMVNTIEKKDNEVSAVPQTQTAVTPVSSRSVQVEEEKGVTDTPIYSSKECDNIDEELIELAEFTAMVNNTSAFHLEEKARALPSPGFTVSNNKKKMLKDIKKRHAELLAKRKKYGCEPL